ncbi:hypothetical protein BGZ58_001381 [Dissophora ornata]|nr:hypothetical protein BGZ58_001381 [Dissophora ornata]
MVEDNLSLFCLVDGDTISRAFSLTIPSTETVGHLKDLIKTKLAPQFEDVAAKDLTLWRVSVPDTDDEDEDFPILLDTVQGKKTLRATNELFDVFKDGLPYKKPGPLLATRGMN